MANVTINKYGIAMAKMEINKSLLFFGFLNPLLLIFSVDLPVTFVDDKNLIEDQNGEQVNG